MSLKWTTPPPSIGVNIRLSGLPMLGIMNSTQRATLALFLFSLALWLLGKIRRTKSRDGQDLKLPGPPRTFFFGNALEIPKEGPWKKFAEWGREYGDIVFAKVFSRRVVLLNSYDVASQLFEKKSANYADRPRRIMAELSGFGETMVFKNYNEDVKQGRRLIHAGLTPRNLQAWYPMHVKEALLFAKRVLNDPGQYRHHARRALVGNLLSFVYGHHIESEDDILVPLGEKTMYVTGQLISPNRYAVDLFPWLNKLPEWFPGTCFKQEAKANRKLMDTLFTMPFVETMDKMAKGIAAPSFVSNLLEYGGIKKSSEADLHLLKMTAGVMITAGVDTTASILSTFFLNMLLNPEVQKKAQRELDSVIGFGALPTFADRDRLPYIECVIKESMRYHPPLPLIARSVRTDDVINGWPIQAGSFVTANLWAYAHDEDYYPNPSVYNPDRFLPKGGAAPPLDPRAYVFGMGRRRCPGADLADNTLFIMIATTLALFNIVPKIDSNGNPIIPEVKYTTNLTSHPVPFPSQIVPRSKSIVKLIEDSVES